MAWVLSAISLITLWLMGSKNKWGPRIGLAGQVLWVIYVVTTEQWGLLLGVIGYTIVQARNVWKWERE